MRKPVLENCQRLHIRDVKPAIPRGATSAALQVGVEELSLIGRLTNLKNGHRYFFLCNSCGKPYESLFSSNFSRWKCRACIGAVYASTRRTGAVIDSSWLHIKSGFPSLAMEYGHASASTTNLPKGSALPAVCSSRTAQNI